jgi:FixJ family two-component response regulator
VGQPDAAAGRAGHRNAGALTDAGPDAIEARFELDLQATGLDEVIRAHLAELDELTRDVLAAMAVWGPDIGTRLFISPRTVQTHVSHILQKTGLRSRVEIARFAEP